MKVQIEFYLIDTCLCVLNEHIKKLTSAELICGNKLFEKYNKFLTSEKESIIKFIQRNRQNIDIKIDINSGNSKILLMIFGNIILDPQAKIPVQWDCPVEIVNKFQQYAALRSKVIDSIICYASHRKALDSNSMSLDTRILEERAEHCQYYFESYFYSFKQIEEYKVGLDHFLFQLNPKQLRIPKFQSESFPPKQKIQELRLKSSKSIPSISVTESSP